MIAGRDKDPLAARAEARSSRLATVLRETRRVNGKGKAAAQRVN